MFIDAKNLSTDRFNLLILNGDYSVKTVEIIITDLNKNQEIVVFPLDINSEKRAIEVKDGFSKAMDLKIKAEKYKLIGNHFKEEYESELENDLERVITFLRESNYSVVAFKQLPADERLKLIKEFERKKDGVTDELIIYYNNLDNDEKALLNIYAEGTLKIEINELDAADKYKNLIDERVIYRNDKYSTYYFLTLDKGEPLRKYLKKYK